MGSKSSFPILRPFTKLSRCLLIDSTRSGKRIPDALSKTVPIWCAVINRAVLARYPHTDREYFDPLLYTPPTIVSEQERRQIESRLDSWARDLVESSYALPNLHLPLRPVWISPATTQLPRFSPETTGFIPVICISASRQVPDGVERQNSELTYVQGSGDDHELWAMGLTPSLFWSHKDELLRESRETLEDCIREVVASSSSAQTPYATIAPSPIQRAGNRIWISTLSNAPSEKPGVALVLLVPSLAESSSTSEEDSGNSDNLPMRHQVPILPGKKGQMPYLRQVLPKCMAIIQQHLHRGNSICISCSDGQDQSVGIAICALAIWFADDGTVLPTPNPQVDKKSIRTRLEWIIASHPSANPSRTTLKRVNEYILSRPFFEVPRYDRFYL